MGSTVGNLFGGGQAKQMKRLQQEQAARQAEQEAKLAAIEAGQKALRDGGKRGQLAYIDELADQLGGSGGGGALGGGNDLDRLRYRLGGR